MILVLYAACGISAVPARKVAGAMIVMETMAREEMAEVRRTLDTTEKAGHGTGRSPR